MAIQSDSSRIAGQRRSARPLRLARRVGFYLAVAVFLLFWGLAFNFQLVAVVTSWFDPVLAATPHFVHDVALASWVWVWGAAMLVQLYRPARRVTAMQAALLLTSIDLGVGLVLTGMGAGQFDPSVLLFFGPVYVAAALHPARGKLLGVPRREQLDPVSLALAGLAVVPVGLYAAGQLNLQATLGDDHAALGHYSTMAFHVVSVVALALLASVRSRGRRFAVYGAGLLAVLFAAASVFQPTASGLDTVWATLAALWGLALVATYELSVRTGAERRRSTGDTPGVSN